MCIYLYLYVEPVSRSKDYIRPWLKIVSATIVVSAYFAGSKAEFCLSVCVFPFQPASLFSDFSGHHSNCWWAVNKTVASEWMPGERLCVVKNQSFRQWWLPNTFGRTVWERWQWPRGLEGTYWATVNRWWEVQLPLCGECLGFTTPLSERGLVHIGPQREKPRQR